jgi:hypothetical protein
VERMVARSRRVSQRLSFHGTSAGDGDSDRWILYEVHVRQRNIVKDTTVKTWIINTVSLPTCPDKYRDERIIAHVHDLPSLSPRFI